MFGYILSVLSKVVGLPGEEMSEKQPSCVGNTLGLHYKCHPRDWHSVVSRQQRRIRRKLLGLDRYCKFQRLIVREDLTNTEGL